VSNRAWEGIQKLALQGAIKNVNFKHGPANCSGDAEPLTRAGK
jgi:hypothetical protein